MTNRFLNQSITDFPHAWGQIHQAPPSARLTRQTNSECVKTPNSEELLRAQFTLANPVVWLYEQWLVSYTCINTCSYELLSWRIMQNPKGWESRGGVMSHFLGFTVFIKKMTLHDWGHEVRYVSHKRLTQELSPSVKKLSVHAWIRLASSLNAATHTNSGMCVKEAKKYSVSVFWKWAKEEERRLLRNWRQKKRLKRGRRKRQIWGGGWRVRCERK